REKGFAHRRHHGHRVRPRFEQDGRELAGVLARERPIEPRPRRFANLADGRITYDTDHVRRLRGLAADQYSFPNWRCVRPQTFRETFRDDNGRRVAWQIDRREIAAG